MTSASPVEPRVESLMRFLDASPSPYHAVAQAAAVLSAAGFSERTFAQPWPRSGGGWWVRRGGALVAGWTPDGAVATRGPRIIGAHTDSPNLRIKPRPDTGALGWRQLAVEIYGGTLLNSWLDRDLGLSGRVIMDDGTERLLHVDRPLLRVPQLAIHLDREVNERGVLLDRQLHLTPVWGLGVSGEGDLRNFLAAELSVPPDAIAAWDLMVHDVTKAAQLGIDFELLASGRLDNLCSCWCALEALRAAAGRGGDRPLIVALFDHEEVGSATTTGADGPLLEWVIGEVGRAAGGGASELVAALADGRCASTDMAHAVHPNYPERHEPAHRPLPNQGPVIKINASQRYATDAVTAAAFQAACQRAEVPYQFFVARNSMPCGSTIGPLVSTRLGIATVDVGCAQLSMHSARELMGAHDPALMADALTEFLLD
ncbi:MAG: apeB [Acidimicrobiia bacterium]|nr:apeB [Acidimicrobiia bacterium]